jgi:hypothetical protein
MSEFYALQEKHKNQQKHRRITKVTVTMMC